MTRFKAVDWKFWIALSLALMVGYLAFVGYAAVEDGREKDRQNAALIRTAEADDAADERERVAAERERAVAAANQAALLAYTKALADQQQSLLRYLRRHGIEIPTRYVTAIPAPKIVNQSPRSRKAAPRRTVPTPDLPGKSERGRDNGKGRR